MADNYLEKRMDDYRSGRDTVRRVGLRRMGGTIKYPKRNIVMIGAGNEKSRAVIKTFVEAGCLVAFTVDEAYGNCGQRIAQECGGRYYPGSVSLIIDDMLSRGEAIDVLIGIETAPPANLDVAKRLVLVDDTQASCTDDNSIVIAGTDIAQISWFCLMFAHQCVNIRQHVVRLE